jgi:hypothetical protein
MKLNNNIIIYLMWLIGCWVEEEIVLIKYINLVFFFFFSAFLLVFGNNYIGNRQAS